MGDFYLTLDKLRGRHHLFPKPGLSPWFDRVWSTIKPYASSIRVVGKSNFSEKGAWDIEKMEIQLKALDLELALRSRRLSSGLETIVRTLIHETFHVYQDVAYLRALPKRTQGAARQRAQFIDAIRRGQAQTVRDYVQSERDAQRFGQHVLLRMQGKPVAGVQRFLATWWSLHRTRYRLRARDYFRRAVANIKLAPSQVVDRDLKQMVTTMLNEYRTHVVQRPINRSLQLALGNRR